jgi:glutamate carboxypeptidase
MIEKFLKELEVLVNIDSGLGAPEGADQVGELLSQPLTERGWLLEKHKVPDACGPCFVLKNREAEHYDVLMIGHIDTVFPAGEALRHPFTRDEKRAYGVGVLDMKQGCLAMVWVLKSLPPEVLEKLNIAVIFNPDEEIGSPYSKDLTDSIARRTDCALVYEAASNTVTRCILRKGMTRLAVEFTGKAGHAGYAFENGGINAVNEMAYWICELAKYHSAETGTTVNAGVAQGGQAANIIPDHAELELDIRYETMDEMRKIEAALEELIRHAAQAGVGLVEKKRRMTPAMEPNEKTRALCALAKEITEDMGYPFTLKKRGGLSDANHISTCGCATLDALGPTGDFDHSEDEYLELSTIQPNLEFSYRLLCKLAEQKGRAEQQ